MLILNRLCKLEVRAVIWGSASLSWDKVLLSQDEASLCQDKEAHLEIIGK